MIFSDIQLSLTVVKSNQEDVGRFGKSHFLDHLSHDLVLMRKKLSDQHGLLTMRRLNRREYHSTLEHLLGADINVGELPSDHNPGHFDTDLSLIHISEPTRPY